MRLRFLLLTVLGVAGLGSSLALADGGKRHDSNQGTTTNCQRTHLRGTASGPVTFVVTVQKANDSSSLTPNQVVTVSLGTTGDTIRVEAGGCANGSTLTARQVELGVQHEYTQTTTTAGDTTTVKSLATTGTGQGHDGHGRGHDHGPPPPTTTAAATTTTTSG